MAIKSPKIWSAFLGRELHKLLITTIEQKRTAEMLKDELFSSCKGKKFPIQFFMTVKLTLTEGLNPRAEFRDSLNPTTFLSQHIMVYSPIAC